MSRKIISFYKLWWIKSRWVCSWMSRWWNVELRPHPPVHVGPVSAPGGVQPPPETVDVEQLLPRHSHLLLPPGLRPEPAHRQHLVRPPGGVVRPRARVWHGHVPAPRPAHVRLTRVLRRLQGWQHTHCPLLRWVHPHWRVHYQVSFIPIKWK